MYEGKQLIVIAAGRNELAMILCVCDECSPCSPYIYQLPPSFPFSSFLFRSTLVLSCLDFAIFSYFSRLDFLRPTHQQQDLKEEITGFSTSV